jgi:L-malate glycosyltransferase
MKILHLVEFYHPVRGGAQEVVRQVSERLVRRGHEVTVATTTVPGRTFERLNGVRVVGFELSGNMVRGIHGDAPRFLRFIDAGNFDVVMTYAAQTWHMDLVLQHIDSLKQRVVLATCGFSALHDPRYANYFDSFADRASKAHAVIVHSRSYRDAKFLSERGLKNIAVIPNGAGEEFECPSGEFRSRHGIPSNRPLLLTVGSHTQLKGHVETIAAFRRSRIGHATLIVNGNAPLHRRGCLGPCAYRAALAKVASLGQKEVQIVDLPRQELVSAFFAADLFVFLSRIECAPLVLYESCAAGLPFVTADVGNAAEIALDSGAGVVVETIRDANGNSIADISDAAEKITQLIKDPDRRRQMGNAGRTAWRSHYHWDELTARYERLYTAGLENQKSVEAA